MGGLVNRVVDDDEVDKAAEDLVASLAAGPTGAFGAAKRLLVEGTAVRPRRSSAWESETISRIAGRPTWKRASPCSSSDASRTSHDPEQRGARLTGARRSGTLRLSDTQWLYQVLWAGTTKRHHVTREDVAR